MKFAVFGVKPCCDYSGADGLSFHGRFNCFYSDKKRYTAEMSHPFPKRARLNHRLSLDVLNQSRCPRLNSGCPSCMSSSDVHVFWCTCPIPHNNDVVEFVAVYVTVYWCYGLELMVSCPTANLEDQWLGFLGSPRSLSCLIKPAMVEVLIFLEAHKFQQPKLLEYEHVLDPWCKPEGC